MYWRQLRPMTKLSPMPEHLDAFTANLRRTREERGLSQEAVGDRAGMTQSQYARIERGDVDPTIKTLKRLATALDVTASELLHGI
jgi:transcriptional regulator with XRE-family HTH domain